MIAKFRVFSVCSICFFAGISAVASDVPLAAIPLIGNSEDFHLDGFVDEDIWSTAAHFRRIALKGTSAFAGVTEADKPCSAPVETEFFVCHDGENLYIAAVCHEEVPGYPQAYPRQPQDTAIMNDDAIMVVLGDSIDETATGESLQMGGYDGAYGKLSDAQFYYTYTVNSAGSMARAFNETPLKRVLFDSAVVHGEKSWSVEMKIPLSSCGIDLSNIDYQKEIFANLIRIRPPDMMGWYLPRYGHYADMPLVKFRLLPAGHQSEATREKKMMAAEKEEAPAAAGYGLSIGYYPLGGKIAGEITQTTAVPGTSAILFIDGKKREEIKLDTPNVYLQWKLRQSAGMDKVHDTRYVVVDIPKGTQSAERTVTLQVLDANHQIVSEQTHVFPAVEAPEWFGKTAKIGADYLAGKVLKDWKKPVVEGNTIILAHKNLTIAPNGLFAQIEDKNGEMLSGPCRLHISIKGKEVAFSPTSQKIILLDNNKVRINSMLRSGRKTCEVKTLVDYDGFTVIKLRIDGISVEDIDRVAVKIPLKHERAKFAYRQIAEQVEPIADYGFGVPAGQFWVGDQNGGIAFNFDSYELFLSKTRRKQMEVVVDDDTTWFTLNFVDEAGQIAEESHIFRFFLLPTPTKEVPMKKVRDYWMSLWENWTPYQGYIDTTQIPKLKDWLVEKDKDGQRGTLYVGHGLDEKAPDFKEFKGDLVTLPEKIVYWRGGKARNTPCYLTSKLGPAAEQQFWGMEKILNETDVAGVVSDGFIIPWEDHNPSHPGNVFQQTLWDSDTPSRYVLMRDFIKRYKGMFEEKKSEINMMDHTGGSFSFLTSTLFDSYLDGETLVRFKRGYQMPLHKFFAYTGDAWGVRSIFWDKHWRKLRGIYWSFTYAFLHNIEISNDPTMINYLIFDDFEDDAKTELFPYWKSNPHVTLQSNHSKMTCYLKEDAALIAVGNFTYYTDPVQVDISRLFPGKKIRIQDMLTGKEVQHQKRIISGDVAGWKLMLLKVSPVVDEQKDEMSDAVVISDYAPSDWEPLGRESEKGIYTNAIIDGQPGCMIRGRAEAEVVGLQLKGNLLTGSSIRVKLRMMLDNTKAITIAFDPDEQFRLHFDRRHGWTLDAKPDLWNRGFLHNRVEVPVKKPVFFDCSIKNGLVNISIDNQPLVVGYKMPPSWKPSTVMIKTEGKQALTFRPVEISSRNAILSEPEVEAEEFLVKQWKQADWKLFSPHHGSTWEEVAMEGGRNAVKLSSRSKNGDFSRIAAKDMRFGQDAYIHLKAKQTGRFNVCYGSVVLQFGPLKILGEINGWNEGYINQNVQPKYNETNDIVIMVNDGIFNVLVNGAFAIRKMKMKLPESEKNMLFLETWAGDEVIVDVVEIRNKATQLSDAVKHPIL